MTASLIPLSQGDTRGLGVIAELAVPSMELYGAVIQKVQFCARPTDNACQ